MKKTTNPSKPCTRCHLPKPLSDFPKVTDNKDGRGNVCKECERQTRKEKKAREEEYGKKYFTF
jgi:hypothetical protein